MCAEQLGKNKKVDSIVLADYNTDAAKKMVARVKSDKFVVKKVDATKTGELRKLLRGCDLVVSSLPWGLLMKALNAAVEAGCDYVDFSMTVDSFGKFREADRMCRRAGITAVTAVGSDPGISDCFAMNAASKLDVALEAHVMDGDSGSAEGVGLFSLWSPIDLLEETTVPAAVYRNGKIEYVPPLHKREIYEFPPPIGPLPVYKTNHEETYLLPRFIKTLKKADFRIAIDDEFANAARWLRKLGMHSLKPVDVKGVEVRPLDVVVALMPRPVEMIGKVKGHAAVVVEVIGKKAGRKTMVKMWTMMSHERAYEIGKSNATGYLVGSGGSVAAEMIIEGVVDHKGLHVPEQLPAKDFISRLPSRGLEVHEQIKVLG